MADDQAAHDSSGKRVRDVLVVDTGGGTASHLAWLGNDAEATTFCGLVWTRPSRAFFEFNGCAKCVRAATAAGVARITDSDGEPVDLVGRL